MLRRLFISVIFLLLTTSVVLASGDVGFVWDPNTESDLAGYRLYQSKVSGVYIKGNDKAVAVIPKGTERASLVMTTGGKYFWVLTAYDTHGNESGFSNEVTKTFNLSAPKIPTGFTINLTIDITGGE